MEKLCCIEACWATKEDRVKCNTAFSLQGKLGVPGLPGYPGRQGPKVSCKWVYIGCFDTGHIGNYLISVFGEVGCGHQRKGHFSHFLSLQSYSEEKSSTMWDPLGEALYGALSFLFTM